MLWTSMCKACIIKHLSLIIVGSMQVLTPFMKGLVELHQQNPKILNHVFSRYIPVAHNRYFYSRESFSLIHVREANC